MPTAEEFLSVPVLGARDSYWLGSAANKALRRQGVPRQERPARIAESSGLLTTSHLPDPYVKHLRSWLTLARHQKSYWGKLRLKQALIETDENSHVRFAAPVQSYLRRLSQDKPNNGCPAHYIRDSETHASLVTQYWQLFARKVFTPYGRKR